MSPEESVDGSERATGSCDWRPQFKSGSRLKEGVVPKVWDSPFFVLNVLLELSSGASAEQILF
ncbi:MAG TPA: hypothetical protein DCF70_01385 [Treponema sp.]|nr:hypothetical protein [Treponema sp.]